MKKTYHYRVTRLGYEPVSGIVEASNAFDAQCHALADFEAANDVSFYSGEGITIFDRLQYFAPRVWKA